jgi:hypothetical protein
MRLDPALPLELAVLKDVVGRLEAAGLEYMLSGSLALSYYATPRMTRDIDIVVALSADSLDDLRRAFELDYYVPDDLAKAIVSPGMFNLLHLDAVMKIDLIVRKQEAYRRTEFERRQRCELGGFQAWLVSREDLILSKLLWARDSRSEQQMRDVRSLLQGDVDADYLDLWAPRLGVADLLSACRE